MGVGNIHRLALPFEMPAIGLEASRKSILIKVDFPRTILANNRVNFTRMDGEINGTIRHQIAKGFGDADAF